MGVVGCTKSVVINDESQKESSTVGTGSDQAEEKVAEPAECMAIIEWVDFLMNNDIKYYQNYEATEALETKQLGGKVGEVAYKLDGNACTGHVSINGDAAYLPVGTPIYELKGYKPEFRVVADNKIYEVNHNPNAETIGELMDIEGRVLKIALESGYDGSHIGDFEEVVSAEFVRELLPLKYVGFEKVYEKTKHESGVFLRVYLQDGTSFRMVYYPQANAFTAGAFGTEKLKELIMEQRKRIKGAAGL
ncbi:hypothetical protein DL346_01250 [Paenibacillus montanisoli]|uniref:Uncharacterized protein n=2 Tax=Paenibacillus montanisoli TaxID=2081970 RepID=A0A328UE00_9BACL|nr:hypothetical protein DL346_01250 [Paenibacillus montanisoli]